MWKSKEVAKLHRMIGLMSLAMVKVVRINFKVGLALCMDYTQVTHMVEVVNFFFKLGPALWSVLVLVYVLGTCLVEVVNFLLKLGLAVSWCQSLPISWALAWWQRRCMSSRSGFSGIVSTSRWTTSLRF